MISIEGELREGVLWLEDFEGFRAKPYFDSVGVETIGIGRNLEVYPFSPEELKDFDKTGEWDYIKARDWAQEHLAGFRRSVIVGCPWVVQCPKEVRLILTDMAYNLGLTGLWNFQKMLKALKSGDYLEAAEQLKDSKYYRQTGRRAKHHYNLLKEVASGV